MSRKSRIAKKVESRIARKVIARFTRLNWLEYSLNGENRLNGVRVVRRQKSGRKRNKREAE